MKHSIHRSLLCLMAVAAASFSGCSWHTDVYDEYNGNKGFFKCSGYCDLSLMNLEDGQTIDETACEEAQAKWTPLTLTANDGTRIESGYCSITSKEQCEALYKNLVNNDTLPEDLWTQQNAMDLGEGRYIVKYENAYYCGSFDALFAIKGKLDTNALSNSCTADEQAKLDHALKGGFCPKDKQECIRFTVSTENTTDQTTDSQNVALCSACPSGQAVCLDFMTAKMGCVDIMSDENHCGSCLTRCASSEKCVQGVCISTTHIVCFNDDGSTTTIYPNTQNTCGATCEDRNGKKCGNNAYCASLSENGEVHYACECNDTNMTPCDGPTLNCISPYLFDSCGVTCEDDLLTTNKKCSYGEKCNASDDNYECQCDQGLLRCSEGCIDPNTNGLHCGATGNCTNEGDGNSAGEICTNGMTCQGSECKCPEGKVKCNGQCLDPLNQHTCGAIEDISGCEGIDCGAKACIFNKNSNTYQCECDGVLCDSNCIDPKTSSDYCGAKGDCQNEDERGEKCTGNYVCNDGDCNLECASNTMKCNFNDVIECVSTTRNLNSDCSDCDIEHCPDKAYDPHEQRYLTCTEKLGDPNNCGGCFYPFNRLAAHGVKCLGDGAGCNGVKCVCPNDSTLCPLTNDEQLERSIDISKIPNISKYGCIPSADAHIDQSLFSLATSICKPIANYDDCDQHWENGFETDLSLDENNCGSCGNVCNGLIPDNSTHACINGQCKFECNDGFAECNGSCVDYKNDNDNCGNCRNKCPANSICQSGSCACTEGLTSCSDRCVDIKTDKQNCGGCGKTCTGNCKNGVCSGNISYNCPSNMADCKNYVDGCETNLMTDYENCGECGYRCDSHAPNQSSCETGHCCRKDSSEIWNNTPEHQGQALKCCSGFTKCKHNTDDKYQCQSGSSCRFGWSAFE